MECTFSKFADNQNWGDCLKHQMVLPPFRETLTGWRNGQWGVSWSSAKGNAKLYIWEACANMCWGLSNWKAVDWEKPWDPGGKQDDHEPAVHLHSIKAKCVLACIRQSIANRPKKMILPLYSELTFQYRGYIDILQHNQYKLTEITKGLEYLLYEKRQRKLALVFLEERGYVGDLLNICKYLFEVNEKGTRLFLVGTHWCVRSKWTQNNTDEILSEQKKTLNDFECVEAIQQGSPWRCGVSVVGETDLNTVLSSMFLILLEQGGWCLWYQERRGGLGESLSLCNFLNGDCREVGDRLLFQGNSGRIRA